jgi:hypothetical protein
MHFLHYIHFSITIPKIPSKEILRGPGQALFYNSACSVTKKKSKIFWEQVGPVGLGWVSWISFKCKKQQKSAGGGDLAIR